MFSDGKHISDSLGLGKDRWLKAYTKELFGVMEFFTLHWGGGYMHEYIGEIP